MNFLKHEDHSGESNQTNGNLDREHLGVEFDESEPGSRLKGLPRLDEDVAAGTTSLGVVLAKDKATVEGDDGLLFFRKESGLNAGKGDSGRDENCECHKESGQRDRQKGKGVVSRLTSGEVTLHEVELLVVHLLRKTEGEGNSNRHDEGDLLGNSECKSREEKDLALLARDHTAEPRLVTRGRDHAVSPDHVNSGKTKR